MPLSIFISLQIICYINYTLGYLKTKSLLFSLRITGFELEKMPV